PPPSSILRPRRGTTRPQVDLTKRRRTLDVPLPPVDEPAAELLAGLRCRDCRTTGATSPVGGGAGATDGESEE
ncbi:hypothetical protein, partial [Streptomyces sp. UNOC14_S4]|uniref:hypothetical protein n=1 Tax=Streptomyces sp. UNOC14_S4 TaxID=2872340 RepID=UPI001E47C186